MVLILVDECSLTVNVALGLAWVLLRDVVDLGQVFLRCLDVLRFGFLLGLGDLGRSCPGFSSALHDLYCEEFSSRSWAGAGAGSDGKTALFTRATSFALHEVPDGAVSALAKRPCSSLGTEKWLQSLFCSSHQESDLGLSRKTEGYRYCKLTGGKG